MKKAICFILAFALIVPVIFAANPSEEDVATATQAAFGVYAGVFMSNLMGKPVDGATLDMNPQTGVSSMILKNVDATALLASVGETIDGSDGMPELPFSHISGTLNTDAEGNMKLDFSFKGGLVKTLQMVISDDDIIEYRANGKDYKYLSDILELDD